MGMYTKLQFRAQIKPEFVEELALIEANELANVGTRVDYRGQTHEFFHTDRHAWLLFYRGGNGYEGGEIVSRSGFHVTDGVLTVATSVKNGDDVVEKFLDWIAPKIIIETVQGEYLYEEWCKPGILQMKDNAIVVSCDNVWFDYN